MKILVIDRDEMSANLMRSRLEPLGHEIKYTALKSDGSQELSQDNFDIVFVDPSPQLNAKPMIANIRRQIRYYPYMVLMSETLNQAQAFGFGLNNILPKPIDPAMLDQTIDNAGNLLGIIRHFRDTSEDFASSGGVIAKSAMNQLFLSSLDRADRHAETSYLLFIGLKNYKQIAISSGSYDAEVAAAKMAQNVVRLRRSSDIIGQVSASDYAILLLRPSDINEPVEAANRFAEALSRCDLAPGTGIDVEVSVSLIEIPTGARIVEHSVTLKN